MPAPSDSLTGLRDAIRARLRAQDDFSGVDDAHLISEEGGELATRIAASLGKLGVLVLVVTPTLVRGQDNYSVAARCTIDFFENVLLNRKGENFDTAPDLLLSAFMALLNWAPAAGAWTAFEFVDHVSQVNGNMIHHTLIMESPLMLS